MSVRPPSRDQFAGCLIGQAIGDALGHPVEGRDGRTCRAYFSSIREGASEIEFSRGHWTFGQYTDDTQLARELLDGWLECGRFDPDVYARRIAAIFAENRIVGRGLATDVAAQRLIAGVPWQDAGAAVGQAGNGTAMRAAPVGLMCYHSDDELVRIACEQGRITHRDPRCDAGSVAIAGGVALALTLDSLDPRIFAGRLASWVRPCDEVMASGIEALPDWIALAPERAEQEIAGF
jgi:ADP-ribosylglycohydrolase